MRRLLLSLFFLPTGSTSAQGYTAPKDETIIILFMVALFAVLLLAIGVMIYENWDRLVFWCVNVGIILLVSGCVLAGAYGLYKLLATEPASHVLVPTWALVLLAIAIDVWVQRLYRRAAAAERERDELQRQLEVLRTRFGPTAFYDALVRL